MASFRKSSAKRIASAPYERAEVEAMLEATGWEIIKVYDAYTINPPHEKSERWFWVVQKQTG